MKKLLDAWSIRQKLGAAFGVILLLAGADAAASAHKSAERGRAVLAATQPQINRLAADVDQAATVIHELEQDSDRIGGVLDAIRGIAEQTDRGAHDLEGSSTELGAVATRMQQLPGTFKSC